MKSEGISAAVLLWCRKQCISRSGQFLQIMKEREKQLVGMNKPGLVFAVRACQSEREVLPDWMHALHSKAQLRESTSD